MNKKLEVGVDEFSLVLFPPFSVDNNAWLQSAYVIMNEFVDLSKIELVCGKITEMYDIKPAAYSQAFTIENVPYYFAIAVHEYFQHMGVLIKFSAHAWSEYKKAYFVRYKVKMNIALFFKMIQSGIYTFRLSRIDFTADYKNYDNVSPHYIYSKLLNESYHIEDHNSRTAKRKLSALQNGFETSTFYVGSRKENGQLLLRVYGKRNEQISQSGFRLEEALNCESWTRFEASFRGKYAHQITEQLVGVNNIDLSQFIASKICDKYRFVDNATGEYTDFTKDLLFVVGNSAYAALRSDNPRNNNLSKAIGHIIKGSGLYPLLFKIGAIWGESAEIEFLDTIYKIYQTYYKKEMERNPTLISWLKKNYSTLAKQKLSDCFIGESLSKFDIAELTKQPPIFNLIKIDTEKTENTQNTKTPNYYKEISDKEFNKLLFEEF